MMKVSVKLSRDILSNLTPSPTLSGTYLPSEAPGRDLEDRWTLDKLPDDGS